ncbi:hypothetical protein [Clostridium sp.]
MKRYKNNFPRDILKKSTEDCLLHDELNQEMSNVIMSTNLKENIIKNTIKQPNTLYENFSQFLNKTVEIPFSFAITVCFVIFISSTLSTFIVTDSMKMDKKLQGYTNIRVMNISGTNVILPKDTSEVIDHFEN